MMRRRSGLETGFDACPFAQVWVFRAISSGWCIGDDGLKWKHSSLSMTDRLRAVLTLLDCGCDGGLDVRV
jgi:hypothetical protein